MCASAARLWASSGSWPVSWASSTDSAASARAAAQRPSRKLRCERDGQRVDQRAHRARVARRGHEPVEDPLRAVELLGPQRRVGGHADHLDDGQRIALEQVRLARAQQRLALLDVAEREVGLGDHRGGQQLDRRVGRRGQRPRPLGGRHQRVHVAGDHVADRGLEEHARRPPRVARADALGLGDQQLVGHQRRAAPHLDVAGHALHVGGQQRVGGQPRRLAEQREGPVRLAGARGVGRRLEQPPRARLVLGRELGGAAEVARRGGVRAAPARVERGRLERRGDLLVGRHRARRQVPGALGAALGRGRGQRGVGGAALGGARRRGRRSSAAAGGGTRPRPRRR